MNTFFSRNNSVEDSLLSNPFFKLYESHLVIKNKKEIKIFRLDEISNVRFSKKRNFTINISLLLITLLIYSFLSDYLVKNFLYDSLLFLVAILSCVISLSIRSHTYVLFINMNRFGFKKLELSKKQSSYAEDFVSFFKTKKGKNINQNEMLFVNFKHSS